MEMSLCYAHEIEMMPITAKGGLSVYQNTYILYTKLFQNAIAKLKKYKKN